MTALSPLDLELITVSAHAAERYNERRSTKLSYNQTAEKIRDLLSRVNELPPVSRRESGVVGRRLVVGELAFIVDPDVTTVITCYHLRQTGQAKRKQAGRKYAKRPKGGKADRRPSQDLTTRAWRSMSNLADWEADDV
jgi:hypothetical protein